MKSIYKVVLQNRDIVSRMIVKYFENCETRYIYRNTNVYAQFLETSHHPELLKNKYDFEMYLLRLFEYGDVANFFDNVMMKDEDLVSLEKVIFQYFMRIQVAMKFVMD